MTTKKKTPRTLTGSIGWLYGQDDDGYSRYELVEHCLAIFRNASEFVVEFEYESRPYTLQFRGTDNGSFKALAEVPKLIKRERKLVSVEASCKLYSNDQGYALLGDSWVEEGYDCRWLAEFTASGQEELSEKSKAYA